MSLSPSPAVLRAADVLAHLAARPTERFTVSELARTLGLPRATCDTVLLALTDRGFVRRDDERRYQLGPSCIVVGDGARAANSALRAAATQAEALARNLGSCTGVSTRDRDETRVAHVFDFGPPFGLRARVGEAIELVPPFGATFVAWDDEPMIEAWLDRGDPPLSHRERTRYRAALEGVRHRGYSVTLVTDRQSTLIDALEQLSLTDETRRARDEAVRHMTHSEYLTVEVRPDAPVRVAQVSAPVFDTDGTVAAVIMLLGPNHDLTGTQVDQLGREVARAASAASAEAA